MARRHIVSDVPMEVPQSHFLKLGASFKDMRVGLMGLADRDVWMNSPFSILASLRVFSSGVFIEAHHHHRERANHPEGVLIYCIGGKGFYRQDNRKWLVDAGDLLYCPPYTHHVYGADKAKPWSICWMHVSGQDLPRFERLAQLAKGKPIRHIGVQQDLIGLFNRMVTRFRPPYDDAVCLAIQADALGILSAVIGTPSSMGTLPVQTQRIQKVMAMMEVSLENPFDLAVYAKAAGYHPNYFTRLFRQVTGSPPVAYFNSRKMHRACELLSMPNQQVQWVASRLGYIDPGFFSKTFTRFIGMAPSVFLRARHAEMKHHPHPPR